MHLEVKAHLVDSNRQAHSEARLNSDRHNNLNSNRHCSEEANNSSRPQLYSVVARLDLDNKTQALLRLVEWA